MSAAAMVSIGDEGVLNRELSQPLSDVWIDRDLGWLDFNDRVLAEALDERTPLLERAKFLAIFTSNLDEFFMKRALALRVVKSEAQRKLVHQLRDKLLPMLDRQADCFRDVILPGLASHGIFLRKWDDLTPSQKDEAGRFFDSHISPALTPLVIDPVHPFPFISNLSTSLVFRLTDPDTGESMYARVKVPTILKQWISLESDLAAGQKVLIPLYEILCGNL